VSDAPRRWYDREPLTIWLPLSAVAAAAVQTASYVGYKLFYNSLGVRPEEVGYDYTSLFPRSAFQIGLLISIALVTLSAVGFVLAFYAVVLKPFFDDLRGRGSELTTPGAHAVAGGLACAFLAVVLANSTGLHGDGFLIVLMALIGLSLLAGHWHARAEGRPQTSVWYDAMRPRVYRGSRRLVLIGAGIALTSVYAPTALSTVALLLALYAADRCLPVVPAKQDVEALGGGRSKWLWPAATLGVAGAVACAFLWALSAVIELSSLDESVDKVRAGERLKHSLLDPLTLAEPRADPVSVSWVGPRPPKIFAGPGARRLTYLGQSEGIAVFLDTAAKPQALHRLPIAAVAIAGPAQSVLLE